MKQWTEQNFFNKGQQEDIDPILSDGQSFAKLLNGRLVQTGGKDYAIQNVKGDIPVTEIGFGFTGTGNMWEIKINPTADLASSISATVRLADPEDGTQNIAVTINGAIDTLQFYQNLAIQLRGAFNAQINSTNIKHYKAAYSNERVVVWLDKGTVITNDNYVDCSVSIPSGPLTSNRYIGRCQNYQPIAYQEFQKEIIVVAVGLNGDSIYENNVDAEFSNQSFQNSVFINPIPPNLTGVWSIKINPNGTFGSTKLIYLNYLNCKLDRILDIEGSEENQDLTRIYLVDSLNPKRFLNIRDENLMVLEPRQIEVFPQIVFSQPILKAIKDTGNLPVCTLQYCYSLLTQNGAETVISPVSQIIPIGNYAEGEYTKGGDATLNTGKSVTIEIDNLDTSFNRIRIYALYSFAGESIDEVELINEQLIRDQKIEITHYAARRGEQFTYEQLLKVNNGFKYAKHLESSEGRLFAASLSNDVPDLNGWDTQVKQYDNNGDTYLGEHNPDSNTYKYLSGTFLNFLGTNSSRIFGAESPGWASGNGIRLTFRIKEMMIEDFRSGEINPTGYQNYFGPWNVAQENYPEGAIVFYDGYYWISASATNVAAPPGTSPDWIIYAAEPKIFDVKQYNVGVSTKSQAVSYLEYFPENASPLYDGNKAPNFSSPHYHQRMAGYTPGETYRIGILPRDLQGNPLAVKYIGDIEIPDFSQTYKEFNHLTNTHKFTDFPLPGITNDFRPFVIRGLLGQEIAYARVVYLDMDVKIPQNIAAQISGYEIVRSIITPEDKKAIASGTLNQIVRYGNIDNAEYSQGESGDMNNVLGNSPFPIQQEATQGVATNPAVRKSVYTLDSVDSMIGKISVNDEFNLQLNFIQELPYKQTQRTRDFRNTNSGEFIQTNLYCFRPGSTSSINGNKTTPIDLYRAVNVGPGELVPKQIIRSTNTDYRNASMLAPEYFPQETKASGVNKFTGNPTIVLRFQNNNDTLGFDQRSYNKSLMQIRRKQVTPYGGRTRFQILNTQWVPTGHYTRVTSSRYMHIVGGGDHYGSLFTYGKAYAQGSWARDRGNQFVYGVSLPHISNINPHFIHGPRIFDPSYNWMFAENFEFNDTFGRENSFRVYITENDEIPTINHQPYSIAVSPQKINGALVDQWLKFPVFDFYEMPIRMGFITDLVSVNNRMYVIQERSVSLLAIDPNALIKSEQTDILIGNGTGRVIADDQVICNYGTSHKSSVVKFPDGFIFLDEINQCYIMVIGTEYRILSDETLNSEQFRSLFGGANKPGDKPIVGKGFSGYYDPVYKELITSIMQ